jgi:surface polysaccharide O-acyltransferase-like enzyme
MISGALILSSNKTDELSTLKKRLPHLIIPLVFWSVAFIARDFYYTYKAFGTFDKHSLFETTVKMVSAPVAVHLWFMYALIPLYILSPFIRKIIVDKRLLKYLLCLWAFGCAVKTVYIAAPESLKIFFNIDLFNKLNYVDGFLGYFVLGYFLHNNMPKIKNAVLTPLIIVLWAVIALGTCYATHKNNGYSEIFKSYTSIWVVALSTLIYITAMKIKELPNIINNVLNYLSSISMGVYMSGNFFLGIMRQEGMTFDTAKGFVLCTIYTVVLCLAFNSLFRFVKPLCFLTTGNKYKKPSE